MESIRLLTFLGLSQILVDTYCRPSVRSSVRPSARHFDHYSLFHVTGMHIKLHIQVNRDLD